MADRTAVIIGGGEQAAQKARLLIRTDARLVIMAPDLDDELAALTADGRARHVPRVYDETEVDRAFAVFCASGCVGVDAWVASRVTARGGVANVVDKPKLCSAITPSLVDRDPLVVAIGTEGVAPVLGQRVKTSVETSLEPDLGSFLAGLRELRPKMMERDLAPSRRAFWNWIMDAPRARAAGGDLAGALNEVAAAIDAGAAPGEGGDGRLTVIALPEAADLLPLRAVRRLQEADLVLHPPGLGAQALELARRDAEREAPEDWRTRAAEARAAGLDVAVLRPADDLVAAPPDAARLGAAAVG